MLSSDLRVATRRSVQSCAPGRMQAEADTGAYVIEYSAVRVNGRSRVGVLAG